MGFKQNWNIVDIVRQINSMAYESNSPHNDGFTGFGIKQDLYRIKWIVDDALKRCPHFVGEEEFIEKHEHQELIKILKGN